jgi:hypothetical protein
LEIPVPLPHGLSGAMTPGYSKPVAIKTLMTAVMLKKLNSFSFQSLMKQELFFQCPAC